MDRTRDLERIAHGLLLAGRILQSYTSGDVHAARKTNNDPVTQADLEIDRALRGVLPAVGEGWLSEETADDHTRLGKDRVWIVDPLDGTKEFVDGIPEWCVSIGLVEKGMPVAGGILNGATGQTIIGSDVTGVQLNGQPVHTSDRISLDGARVLASRSELRRGDWDRFSNSPIQIVPTGSVAYKLALVAAGLADATWTLTPKNEWDVAAGAALVRAGGGVVRTKNWSELRLNRPKVLLNGLIACAPGLSGPVADLLGLGTL